MERGKKTNRTKRILFERERTRYEVYGVTGFEIRVTHADRFEKVKICAAVW